ncbi:uncharacterized protein B0T23DRAFT_197010 [Neurospora hispaniola]|uniref:3-beta hydroxysteroid dehydrogenase/isomerase domain-containing protein n=1 Tax=Neurospora hispaniola TaxID=588809 RepID=A0AAJ0MPG5_9PEZI|nr:hypothetical protein B0T23DRAFT_197010 [Neurospora hispaniola]
MVEGLDLWPLSLAVVIVGALWVYGVNRTMRTVPPTALKLSPNSNRWSKEYIRETYERVKKNPVDIKKHLPPKMDRRYIVVGGSGLVGGDIVSHLLARGQSAESVRIVDFAPLRRPQILSVASKVEVIKTDITSPDSVKAAFSKPWPASVASLPLTVYHTAAVIRPGERSIKTYDRVARVNVGGTSNVLAAAKEAGADIFIATSSSSVALEPMKFWKWPLPSLASNYVQVFNEDDFDQPLKAHDDFFGNYARAKAEAERLVCAANQEGFRTGVVRPGNGIFGDVENDVTFSPALKAGSIVSWTPHVIQNWISSRNVSIAHLLFEAALNPSVRPVPPACAGRPLLVTDPGPPIAFQDFYTLSSLLSITPITETYPPPVLMLILAHAIEGWANLIINFPVLTKLFGWKEPTGDLAMLQPAVFTVSAYTICDDSRARKSVEEGGIGYKGVTDTLYGFCEQMAVWNGRVERGEAGLLKGMKIAKPVVV